MRVLVTGGAGYIGSHAVKSLISAGHEVTVLDDLSKGHREAVHPRASLVTGNCGDADLVEKVLKLQQIEAVLHFAANIEVGESVSDPGKYYNNNVGNSIALLNQVAKSGVKRFVFSSTAAVYGEPEYVPIDEAHPTAPINPYGRTKWMTEAVLEDFRKAHGIGYAILRYFNVCGASPDGEIGEDHHPESHLIPRLLQAARDGEPAKIFGMDYPTRDGSCVRDYVHVVDLASAHVLALEHIEAGIGEIFNVGSESGFTVKEVLRACEQVVGRGMIVRIEDRRPGDPASLVASSTKLRERLGWKPQYPALEDAIRHAWNWHRTHPNGFASVVGSTGETGETSQFSAKKTSTVLPGREFDNALNARS